MNDEYYQDDWLKGQEAWFEYHCNESHTSADAELWYHSHQRVTIVQEQPSDGRDALHELKTGKERCEAGCPRCYQIRFADGFVADAMEDELLTSPAGFTRPNPPKPKEITPIELA